MYEWAFTARSEYKICHSPAEATNPSVCVAPAGTGIRKIPVHRRFPKENRAKLFFFLLVVVGALFCFCGEPFSSCFPRTKPSCIVSCVYKRQRGSPETSRLHIAGRRRNLEAWFKGFRCRWFLVLLVDCFSVPYRYHVDFLVFF